MASSKESKYELTPTSRDGSSGTAEHRPPARQDTEGVATMALPTAARARVPGRSTSPPAAGTDPLLLVSLFPWDPEVRAPFQVTAAPASNLDNRLRTSAVFRIRGYGWHPGELVDVIFYSLFLHSRGSALDQAELGPTVRASASGQLNGYWGGVLDNANLGPYSAQQGVWARGVGGWQYCEVAWLH